MSVALELRRATPTDGELLLDWRNDPATREASGNRASVAAEEHAGWLERVLAEPDRHLVIAEADGRPVGQARIERRRAYRYELSVSLDAAERGRGVGATLIAGACEWAWAATNASGIEAWVRDGNEPSLRAFEKAGFEPGPDSRPGFVNLWLGRPEPFAPERPVDRRRRLPFRD
jgi:RimJ/RimL family protein N-acetyltransferase